MLLLAAAGVMFSCSLESITDDFPDTDLQFAQLRIAQAVAGSCEDDCIEPGSDIYYPVSDEATLSVGPNTKSVSYTAYNTETDFVVDVTYAITSGRSNPEATITIDIDGNEVEYTGVIPGSTVSHTVPLAEDWAGCDAVSFSILQEGLGAPITFNESYALIPVCLGQEPGDVISPTTGKTWMDRNLGATQVATSSTDAASYGDLYQWGRGTDGHQIRTSGTTATLSTTDIPGHGDFIASGIVGSFNWRSPPNTNLWQGVNGVNNPCPSGYRLPTETELNEERLSWSSNNAAGAFASPLKLPMAGYRGLNDGSLFNVGTNGDYWSSTVSGGLSRSLFFNSGSADMSVRGRALGISVRCLKD